MPDLDLNSLPLRERKKALTRRSIIDAAQCLFDDRGYDEVTVAEIADAANVSVKTLFVYFRSKEDLVFADNTLLDALLAALARRPATTTVAQAVAATLLAALAEENPARGLADYHRAYGDSPALQSGLQRMWAEFEDRITTQLAAEHPGPPTAGDRFTAIQLVGMVRSLTAPELRRDANADPAGARRLVEVWIESAAARVDRATAPPPQSA